MKDGHSTFRGVIRDGSVARMPRYEYKYKPDFNKDDLSESYNGTAGSCERLCSRDPRCTGYNHKGKDCFMYSEEYHTDAVSSMVSKEETVKFKKNYTLAKKDQCNFDCLKANVICPFDTPKIINKHADIMLNMCCTQADAVDGIVSDKFLDKFGEEIANGTYRKLCEQK